LEEDAAAMGAVNTILFRNGTLKGFNTDVYGFQKSLEPLLKPHHTKALVLGTGGAAKAVIFALQKMGIAHQSVSRTAGKNILSYADLNEAIIQEHSLIIQTTPLGMYPATENCPDIPYSFLNQTHLLYDLVYNPSETLFLKKGREKGAKVKNGLEMLHLQAERAWFIWNNIR
jgi:shikimate dehydrogenase